MRAHKIITGEDYIHSLRGRGLKVFLMGRRWMSPLITR